jgi:hypothetical protein
MYFIAITKKKPSEISLSQEAMSSLLGAINARSAIYTGAAIEPKYLINTKGVTTWIAMFAFISSNNPNLVKAIGTGPGAAWVPPDWMNSAFGNHINWPDRMLRDHNLDVKGYKLVAIPFLVPNNAAALKNLSLSIKAPDDSLEVLGFHEFDEKNPKALLGEFVMVADSLRNDRRVIPAVKP